MICPSPVPLQEMQRMGGGLPVIAQNLPGGLHAGHWANRSRSILVTHRTGPIAGATASPVDLSVIGPGSRTSRRESPGSLSRSLRQPHLRSTSKAGSALASSPCLHCQVPTPQRTHWSSRGSRTTRGSSPPAETADGVCRLRLLTGSVRRPAQRRPRSARAACVPGPSVPQWVSPGCR